MTIRVPGWLQALTYTAENDRLAMQAFTSPVGSGTSAQYADAHGWDGGVGLTYANVCFKVSQRGAGANMSVDIAPGFGTVPGQSSTTQGMYTVASDAVVNAAIATSSPSNPRIDLVYMQVADAGYSGVTNAATFGVVTGTPAPSPAVPTLPANSIALARVLVGTSVSSIVNANITDVRLGLGAAGGLAQARSSFMPTYAPNGQQLFQTDTGAMKVFSLANVWEDLLTPGASVAYTPSWTAASGTAPAIGNGTVTGRYIKIGRTCTVWVNFQAGSTTTFGSGGNLRFSLPVTGLVTSAKDARSCGDAYFQSGGTNSYVGTTHQDSSTTFVVESPGATTTPTNPWRSNWPNTANVADWLTCQLTYETAA